MLVLLCYNIYNLIQNVPYLQLTRGDFVKTEYKVYFRGRNFNAEGIIT